MPRRPPAVARVLERVTITAREHGMFAPGDRVLVAVSGGPDSTCLLHALWMLRRLFRIEPEVFHFDHGLRPGSRADARYVRRMASRLRMPFHARAARSRPAPGESIEAWARIERWRAADEVKESVGAAVVAVAHTLDDQAETALLALVRGGGIDHLSGMRPKVPGSSVRPLIGVRREEVEAFCRALHLRPRIDPTNDDTRFLRNALRRDVMPVLERATGRDVKGAMARSADLMSADAHELWRQAEAAFAAVVPEGPAAGRLVARELSSLPPPIAARVALMALAGFVPTPPGPTREDVRAVLDLAVGRPGRRRDLHGGLIVVRGREYVRLSRTSPGDRDERQPTAADHGGSSDGRPARTRTRARPRRVAPRGSGS